MVCCSVLENSSCDCIQHEARRARCLELQSKQSLDSIIAVKNEDATNRSRIHVPSDLEQNLFGQMLHCDCRDRYNRQPSRFRKMSTSDAIRHSRCTSRTDPPFGLRRQHKDAFLTLRFFLPYKAEADLVGVASG